ncbi:hypothetical protein ASZ78_008721, partial [Callipepla squamata]
HFLHNLIFRAWRAYVCQQQGKRNAYYIAESHGKYKKDSNYFGGILRWELPEKMFAQNLSFECVCAFTSFTLGQCNAFSTSWSVWRRRCCQICTGRKMNILALQHWAQSLQFRAWLQWRDLYLKGQNDKQKETRAVAHHVHGELKRCMEAWLEYVNICREKKRQNELAREHHQVKVIRQRFSDWRLSWECRRRVHAHQKDLEKLSARITLWRIFARWKHCIRFLCSHQQGQVKSITAGEGSVTDVILRVEETLRCELAEKHHRHHLLYFLLLQKFGFKGLQQNVVNSHLNQMRKNLSFHQHRVTVLKKFWNCWKSRLEEKEEQQQQALTSMAHTHYRYVDKYSHIFVQI